MGNQNTNKNNQPDPQRNLPKVEGNVASSVPKKTAMSFFTDTDFMKKNAMPIISGIGVVSCAAIFPMFPMVTSLVSGAYAGYLGIRSVNHSRNSLLNSPTSEMSTRNALIVMGIGAVATVVVGPILPVAMATAYFGASAWMSHINYKSQQNVNTHLNTHSISPQTSQKAMSLSEGGQPFPTQTHEKPSDEKSGSVKKKGGWTGKFTGLFSNVSGVFTPGGKKAQNTKVQQPGAQQDQELVAAKNKGNRSLIKPTDIPEWIQSKLIELKWIKSKPTTPEHVDQQGNKKRSNAQGERTLRN